MTNYLTDRYYSFVSKALASDTFTVVDIKGEEGLSRCYHFEILLVSENPEIDMNSVLRNRATFTVHRGENDAVHFHGIPAAFEQQHAVGSSVFYRIVLVPRLWRLHLSHHNQVFLDQNVREIIETVLKDGGLTSADYEFKLQGTYSKLAYVCQYGESHFNFMSRWLEREGIYYYFEQTDAGEKIIFTDTAIAHQSRAHGKDLDYAPPSGMLAGDLNEVVMGLLCQQKPVPQKLRLKDYNYRKPTLEVAAAAMVDENSSGEVYIYGEHFRTPEDGARLAGIRAQELLCGKETFIGNSTVPYLSPGYTFVLGNHYRNSYNQKYLTISITHEGSQAGFLTDGLRAQLTGRDTKSFYRNQFSAIAAGVQYRPPRTAQRPKITGALNAKIDAAGSGQYAELDEHGRYKVVLPFDLSGRKGGKASIWLRMAQPYAGAGHGMHFPLHKDTEVLLTFIDGNPDRPVIAAAVPNPETRSPVTDADQTMAKVTTGGGNKIHIEDKDGNQRILMHSPTSNTYMRLGAPNDPESGDDNSGGHDEEEEKELAGAKLFTSDALKIVAGSKNEMIFGEEGVVVIGNHNKWIGGLATDITAGIELGLKTGGEAIFTPKHTNLRLNKTEMGETATHLHDVKTNLVDKSVDFHITKELAAATAFMFEEESTEIQEEALKATQTYEQVSEASTKLTEVYNKVIQDHNKIVATDNTVAETVNTLGEAINTLAETVTVLAETDVAMAETQISLAESYVITSAETIIL